MTLFSLLVLVLVLQLGSALWSLPAPVNLSITSLNLQHVLHWDPGPGSPTGTQYCVFRRVRDIQKKLIRAPTTKTSIRLKLDHMMKTYHLTVQAVLNDTKSPQSGNLSFTPFTDTTIGPPVFSLVGCGTCIQGNISLPIPDMDSFDPSFMVWWRNEKNGKEYSLETRNRSFILRNLERRAKFCVRIQIKSRLNPNMLLSDWTCTFSSPEDPDTALVLTGVVSALLVFVPVVLTTVILCLCYTGFICKLRKERPQALMDLVMENPILTPDRTTSDQIFMSADPRNQRNPKHPTVPPPPTGDANSEEEEEDEEEDDRIQMYVDRAAELSSGQSSQQDSGRNLKASGSLRENPAAEVMEDPQAEPDQYESNTERLCLIPEGGRHSGVQDPIAGQEEEIQDICGDVNLFSVTLASLAPCEEEEEDTRNSFSDLLKEQRPNSRSQVDSKTDLSHKMFGEDLDWSSRRPTDPCIQPEEEEEEEEEFSGYLTHK